MNFFHIFFMKYLKSSNIKFGQMTKKKKEESIWDSFNPEGLMHIPKSKNLNWKGDPSRNAKNTLQEYCQKFFYPLPEYKLIRKEGELLNPLFIVAVIGEVGINYKTEKLYTTGEGRARVFAELKAAEKACDMLG